MLSKGVPLLTFRNSAVIESRLILRLLYLASATSICLLAGKRLVPTLWFKVWIVQLFMNLVRNIGRCVSIPKAYYVVMVLPASYSSRHSALFVLRAPMFANSSYVFPFLVFLFLPPFFAPHICFLNSVCESTLGIVFNNRISLLT